MEILGRVAMSMSPDPIGGKILDNAMIHVANQLPGDDDQQILDCAEVGCMSWGELIGRPDVIGPHREW